MPRLILGGGGPVGAILGTPSNPITPQPLPQAPPIEQPTPVGQPVSTVYQPVPVPTLTVNANGILELPYNNQFSSQMLDAFSNANNSLLDLKTQADQQALAYGQGLRNADQNYGQQKRTTKNSNASRGTLYSSKYATGVVNDATGYANTRADLESKNTASEQDIAARRSAIQQSLQNQLGRLAQEQADALNNR